jgi:penicillin-binding protein A
VTVERRKRLLLRTLPVLGGLAFAAGLVAGAGARSADERGAVAFAEAWQRRDFGAMHALLSERTRRAYRPAALRRAYARAAATATAESVDVADSRGERDGRVIVPVAVRTRVFGVVRGELLVPVDDGLVEWGPELVFPGLEPGVRLTRRSRPPQRAALLSHDGDVLARGPANRRSSPIEIAGSIAGRLAPAESRAERAARHARGFPPDWPVGQNGLELAFERRLAGRPGGELRAGKRVLARARPRPAGPVRTTIDTRIQAAAVTALAGRFGGIAALDPTGGEIRALAGIAFSGPQPPGSTFKIVTATAALESGAVELSTPFPVRSAATIEGVRLENANGEYCGGSFRSSFAHSCNSVFAPLGVRVGARRLVNAARRYGWNSAPSVPGEVASTLPPAAEIRTPLELASTAIGQGKLLATPLRLASVAQVVASGGVRREPSLLAGAPNPPVRVTTPAVARELQHLMVDAVDYGTGTAAAIPGVRVAGKTGTAELEDTRGRNAVVEADSDESNTDAWFTAYAPAGKPRLAVAVMLVRAGAGGATAAPAARFVLEAALAAS